ncbi:hypothetical protein KIN20_031985 [Parelaphostrongylus tenuis]|uniref:Uncharacterized protein n=1 Tax=Parelaphostrongylus tenuis TaxID=148309 RepID=A0AAD5R693_PARTN|nr:hypothetical protein KIN20_031985 [Parelaphostrongylus tenuis]
MADIVDSSSNGIRDGALATQQHRLGASGWIRPASTVAGLRDSRSSSSCCQ